MYEWCCWLSYFQFRMRTQNILMRNQKAHTHTHALVWCMRTLRNGHFSFIESWFMLWVRLIVDSRFFLSFLYARRIASICMQYGEGESSLISGTELERWSDLEPHTKDNTIIMEMLRCTASIQQKRSNWLMNECVGMDYFEPKSTFEKVERSSRLMFVFFVGLLPKHTASIGMSVQRFEWQNSWIEYIYIRMARRVIFLCGAISSSGLWSAECVLVFDRKR